MFRFRCLFLRASFVGALLCLPSLAWAECTSDGETLCLNSGRFAVQATYVLDTGESGEAQVVALTSDTGYLWFFKPDNVEVVVKVLTGCPFNGHYWVFAAGLTNVEVTLTVTDTETQQTQTYKNPQGQGFKPIQAVDAFPTCPAT